MNLYYKIIPLIITFVMCAPMTGWAQSNPNNPYCPHPPPCWEPNDDPSTWYGNNCCIPYDHVLSPCMYLRQEVYQAGRICYSQWKPDWEEKRKMIINERDFRGTPVVKLEAWRRRSVIDITIDKVQNVYCIQEDWACVGGNENTIDNWPGYIHRTEAWTQVRAVIRRPWKSFFRVWYNLNDGEKDIPRRPDGEINPKPCEYIDIPCVCTEEE